MKKTVITIIVLLLIGFGLNYYFEQRQEEFVACTEEALLCPDGSGVGRTGSDCKFAACPAVESLTGKLEQTPDGFRLVMETPFEGSPQVNYVVPIEIKVSNVLGQIVGRKVEVFGEFKEGNIFEVEVWTTPKTIKADKRNFADYRKRFLPYLGEVVRGSNEDLVLKSE